MINQSALKCIISCFICQSEHDQNGLFLAQTEERNLKLELLINSSVK